MPYKFELIYEFRHNMVLSVKIPNIPLNVLREPEETLRKFESHFYNVVPQNLSIF